MYEDVSNPNDLSGIACVDFFVGFDNFQNFDYLKAYSNMFAVTKVSHFFFK